MKQHAETKEQLISEIYLDYRLMLTKFLRSWTVSQEEAEDIVQATFTRVCAMENPWEIDDIRAFLFQVARNIAIDRYRSNRSTRNRDTSYVIERDLSCCVHTPEEILYWRQIAQSYLEPQDNLPQKAQRIFQMSRINGSSYKEISHALGISVSMVQKYMTKAVPYYFDRFKKDTSSEHIPPFMGQPMSSHELK